MLCTRQTHQSPALFATPANTMVGVYLCGHGEVGRGCSPIGSTKAIARSFAVGVAGAQPRNLDWLGPGS